MSDIENMESALAVIADVERRYEATIARIEERLIDVQQERDALAAQIAATKQAVSYFADRIEPHVYGEISSELDDDPLNDDGPVFRVALAKVKAEAWDEGFTVRADPTGTYPPNPYRTEAT